MSFVHNYSDRVNRARLCDKGDMDILASHARAAEYPERVGIRIKQMEQEIAAEQASKYPDADYIARRQAKIAEIQKGLALYELQRRK